MHSELIYGNLSTRSAASSASGDSYTFPTFLVGKQYPISLRWIERINGVLQETFKDVRSLRATVGNDDLRPTGNSTKLKVGAGVAAAGNTTSAISFAASAADLEAKLNALADFAAVGFTVVSDRGSYLIRRADGTQVTITARENRFLPVSFVRVRSWEDDDGWVTEVRFIQSPLAFQDTATPKLPQEPYFDPVADGVDYGNGVKQNEVQNLIRPSAFRGQFYILYKATEESEALRTQLFSRSDGIAQYKAGLDAVLAPQGGSVTVTNPETGIVRVEFGGDLVGVNIPPMTVEVPEEGTPPGDWTFILDLNTIEAWSAVRGLKPGDFLEIPFELEIDVPEDPEDEESASMVIPVWQTTIKLRRPLTTEGLATAQPVNWLRKPNPKKYLPYNQSQIGIGALYYEQAIGDGVATTFEIDHNLGVASLTGLCLMELDTGRVLQDSEYTKVSANEGNTLELTFADAPAADNILVTLASPQPIEFFINDLEIEISQVNGLQTILTDYGTRLGVVEAKVLPGVAAVASSSTASQGLVTVIPEISEVLFYTGSTDGLFTDKGVDAKLLNARRAPYMLPAVHDATPTDPMPDPLPAAAADTVWVAGERTLIPGGGGIRSAYVENDGNVASDGRMLYVATRSGTTKSYFPAAFERTLFAMAINDKMLAVNRTLEILFGVQFQLIHATCTAQWVLSLQIGTFAADTEPATLGLNLDAVNWADPVFSQAIVLSRLAQSHFFGIRIKRTVAEMLLDQQLYGADFLPNNDAAPADANFAIRGRLDRFDTEDKPDPRGYVAMKLIGGIEISADGKQTTKPAQARIY